jgi:hypothetical protein
LLLAGGAEPVRAERFIAAPAAGLFHFSDVEVSGGGGLTTGFASGSVGVDDEIAARLFERGNGVVTVGNDSEDCTGKRKLYRQERSG